MARETFVSAVIAELGQQLGLAGLALDENGRLSLDIGELELTFTLGTEPTDFLWLHVRLAEPKATPGAPDPGTSISV